MAPGRREAKPASSAPSFRGVGGRFVSATVIHSASQAMYVGVELISKPGDAPPMTAVRPPCMCRVRVRDVSASYDDNIIVCWPRQWHA